MTRGRHSLAPPASKKKRLSYLAAPLVTSAVVGAGVAVSGSATDPAQLSSAASGNISAAAPDERSIASSRDAARAVVTPVKVTDRRWTTADLDLRVQPADDARVLGEVSDLTRIGITGVRRNGFAQVVLRQDGTRTVAWVTEDYLVAKKPTSPADLPTGGGPCPGTSGVENGLTAGAVRVYRAVCNNFPQITRYGGRDGHGEHSTGRAIDIMTSDVQLGTAIAEFLRANAAEFNLYNVIWRQRIYTQERGGEGWRPMSSRGSATANHYDHVHVSVY